MISVACVLRSGGRYDASWVAKLQRGVARHLSLPHRFVCLSDEPVDCERIPLETDWPGWWSKIEMFRPGLLTGQTLYLDLDTVITGPLAPLLSDQFTMTRDFLNPNIMNSGVMAWAGDYSIIWEAMKVNPAGIIEHYDAWPDGRIGDQALIEDVMRAVAMTFNPGLVVSWKRDCRNGPPAGASAVSFHGRKKQDDLLKHEWIRTAWN
ncbi:hypothetical protein ACFQFQ_14595 [Sulfitobacter porphyrae]|uniref:Glycosyltransferase n=1 Tax=Sulfitobacter porphyrae TaxID=1246864 RepID=A0ABW2B4E2_9RHOB